MARHRQNCSVIPIAISAGIYGSASTWAFNAIAGLLRSHNSCDGDAFFADELDTSTIDELHNSWAVIKTHSPGPILLTAIRWARAPVVITVRDPRDCAVSMMQRFNLSFENSLDLIANSAARILCLMQVSDPLLIKYECTNGDRNAILERIRDYLNLNVTREDIRTIALALSPQAVRRQIEKFSEAGVYVHGDAARDFDPKTHWHPGHVGDGASGKYLKTLDESQIAQVIDRTQEFCKRFD
jgi:hypothetical protein